MLIVKISCEGKFFTKGGFDRGCPCTGVPPVILNRVPRLLELFGVEATRCQNASCRVPVRARSTALLINMLSSLGSLRTFGRIHCCWSGVVTVLL
jgi:hypothetical protein